MEQQIPMVDLRAHFAPLRAEILEGVGEILDQAGFILGAHGRSLEAELSEYLGVAHGVGCASGTDALLLALRALDIGPGDEVIVPTFTFIATAEAVRYVGATPVFADVDAEYFCVTAESVAPLISKRTRAIIPVHLYGQPAPMPELLQLAEQHGIPLIEDMAQAIGARFNDQRVGSFGRLACVSFFPSKNLGGAGDGGMVFTQDEALATRLRGLRNHGSWQTYEHEVLGYNSRLDEIQALILRKLFRQMDEYNAGRRRAAGLYDAALQDLSLQVPMRRAGAEHVFHQYTIQIDERDALRARLHAEKIGCGVYYPIPCHQQRAFADLAPSHCPVAERLKERVLSLPMFPELSSAQVERIAGVIRAHLQGG
ncbi:DegT/DnrJ/EryC1/StrS family aminotransferase [Acidithiobacillus sp. IBUN Pt1247-S3]|uniref:DegT/DnrJ/EryC1/StrS family aminotransferase n=1 Tax=Acidithiobacillus sp. IBUN Pt1247-S3 TaxID=3166642 RepID=UPI0034E5FC8A